ncbi:MAG: glycerophosphodiester phosphodiesterase family protein [Bacteroidales bacterium]|nr:glycerophosphodiester phosphodiesterase family protein [Bacteroidales bacterium]MDZ4204053.1 glycerophosphodiester phosphodiesterase family protein [Bacteroidales bacterium]
MRKAAMGVNLVVLFAAIIPIIFDGCKKPSLEQYTPTHLERIMVVGHGGGGITKFNQYFPLNSAESVRKTIEGYGADGVEVDVQFTSDLVPVLYHGSDLYEKTNCKGPVCSKTWAELNPCFYRHNLNAGEGINQAMISLEQLTNLYNTYPANLFLILEAKLERFCWQPYETIFEFANVLNEEIVKANLPHRIIVEAKDVNFLNYMRLLNPSLILIYYASGFDSGYPTALAHGYHGFLVHHKNITAEQVKVSQDAGLWIILFGTRTYDDNVSAIKKSPEIITSDNIPLTLGLLEKARNKS